MRTPPECWLHDPTGSVQWAEAFVYGRSPSPVKLPDRSKLWEFDTKRKVLEFELSERSAHGRLMSSSFQLSAFELRGAGDHVRDMLARKIRQARARLRKMVRGEFQEACDKRQRRKEKRNA